MRGRNVNKLLMVITGALYQAAIETKDVIVAAGAGVIGAGIGYAIGRGTSSSPTPNTVAESDKVTVRSIATNDLVAKKAHDDGVKTLKNLQRQETAIQQELTAAQ